MLPVFGRTVQHTKEEDTSPKPDKEGIKCAQQVTGTFFDYARAVDPTISVTLSAIVVSQSAPTEQTLEKTLFFLDYAVTHPDAILTYCVRNMVPNVYNDASCLTEPKARSRAGGHWFMSSDEECAKNNGAVLTIAKIIRNVMTSAAGAEIGVLYINARQTIPVSRLLEEMGHKHPATPIQTDNTTALGFITKNLKPKATKSEDMNYWLMRDKQDLGQFRYYWGGGKHNDDDYQI